MAAAFTGRTVVVTGAASGIGAEMARLFIEAGADVVASDIDLPAVQGAAACIRTDVSDEDSVRELIDSTVRARGGIDILCNNAGIGSTTDVVGCSLDEWERVFAVNVRGVFLGTKYAVPGFLERGHGVIVNTASAAGLIGLPDRAAYCASKAAVIGLTKQVAVQYARNGIRCNCICPGTVDSPWVGRLLAEADDPVQRRADLVARQPLGRLATPTEIAHAALYLAGDEAAFATGTCLVLDGGITAA
jgi:NAD(P)-dependent dehydrogenase (short-subunit alcohol dehydrogenase family)